jgi:hypothetical protein
LFLTRAHDSQLGSDAARRGEEDVARAAGNVGDAERQQGCLGEQGMASGER